MKNKTCFKCGIEKTVNCFYKHKKMADGYLGKCKDCTKKDTQKNRNENLDYYQEYDRKRANLPKRVALRKRIAKNWATDPKLKKIISEGNKRRNKTTYKLERAAHIITGNAIRSGRLIKEPCEVCGKKKVEAHHDDYNYPMTVRWLCRKHHIEHHKIKREKERKL